MNMNQLQGDLCTFFPVWTMSGFGAAGVLYEFAVPSLWFFCRSSRAALNIDGQSVVILRHTALVHWIPFSTQRSHLLNAGHQYSNPFSLQTSQTSLVETHWGHSVAEHSSFMRRSEVSGRQCKHCWSSCSRLRWNCSVELPSPPDPTKSLPIIKAALLSREVTPMISTSLTNLSEK